MMQVFALKDREIAQTAYDLSIPVVFKKDASFSEKDIKAVLEFEAQAMGTKPEDIPASKIANFSLIQEAERELKERSGKF